MPTFRSALLTSLLFASAASGQFPLLHTTNESIRPIHSLGSGLRYINDFIPGQPRTIYNLDLSIHRVLNFPAAPSGMYWGSMVYITEELFDTDPSTIEFVLTASSEGGFGDFAVFVYREDGTLLFSKSPGSLVDMVGGGLVSNSGIFTIDGETFMILHENGPTGPPTRIYALPGTLPCIDCRGAPTMESSGLGTGPSTDFGSGVSLFPNPANSTITLDLGDRRSDEIRIHDANGSLVQRRAVTGLRHVQMSTSALAIGRYTVQVLWHGQVFATLPLVVSH